VSDLRARKLAHLDLCIGRDVESHRSTLLEEVHLIHEALPELAWHEVDPSVELFGRRLLAPLLVSGMTGGTPEAGAVNRALAAAAQKLGLGFGVGSQRAMLVDPAAAGSYRVRDVAPDVLLLANLGAVQARDAGPERVAALAREIGADAVCIHLNAAQELVQDDGDRDFRGLSATLAELAGALPIPVVAKETGCGLAPRTLARLRGAGVAMVDVSGAGGTSWTGVEALRGSGRQRALGETLREWGIPTAASLLFAERAGMPALASGGIRSALDVVRALALGARAAALALPFLRAWASGGASGLLEAGERLVEGVQAVMALTGVRRVDELPRAPRVLGPELARWAALVPAEPSGTTTAEPSGSTTAEPAGTRLEAARSADRSGRSGQRSMLVRGGRL
jgi:isopentenyl-diphosphate delta-isomerase